MGDPIVSREEEESVVEKEPRLDLETVLVKLGEWWRYMRSAGLHFRDLQIPIDGGLEATKRLVAYWLAGMPQRMTPVWLAELNTMGNHVCPPRMVEAQVKARYDTRAKSALSIVPFGEKDLIENRDSFMLIPGFPLTPNALCRIGGDDLGKSIYNVLRMLWSQPKPPCTSSGWHLVSIGALRGYNLTSIGLSLDATYRLLKLGCHAPIRFLDLVFYVLIARRCLSIDLLKGITGLRCCNTWTVGNALHERPDAFIHWGKNSKLEVIQDLEVEALPGVGLPVELRPST